MTEIPEPEELMTPAEVGVHLGVDTKTVARWASAGRLPSIRTLGGHRRYRRSDIVAIAAASVSGIGALDGAMHTIWSRGDWRALTSAMSLMEREASAAAVVRHDDQLNRVAGDGEPLSPELLARLRWWRHA